MVFRSSYISLVYYIYSHVYEDLNTIISSQQKKNETHLSFFSLLSRLAEIMLVFMNLFIWNIPRSFFVSFSLSLSLSKDVCVRIIISLQVQGAPQAVI